MRVDGIRVRVAIAIVAYSHQPLNFMHGIKIHELWRGVTDMSATPAPSTRDDKTIPERKREKGGGGGEREKERERGIEEGGWEGGGGKRMKEM